MTPEYKELVGKVREIDSDAADWLENDAEKIMGDSYLGFDFDKHLSCCFNFYDAPQGHDYWHDIYFNLERPYGMKR